MKSKKKSVQKDEQERAQCVIQSKITLLIFLCKKIIPEKLGTIVFHNLGFLVSLVFYIKAIDK